jgi:hypothetical protein
MPTKTRYTQVLKGFRNNEQNFALNVHSITQFGPVSFQTNLTSPEVLVNVFLKSVYPNYNQAATRPSRGKKWIVDLDEWRNSIVRF